MALRPVTVKLDDKEIRYLDRQIGKGKITSRSSAVRAIVRESMERTDLCRGSAWTDVNRSSANATGNGGTGGRGTTSGTGPQARPKVPAKPFITFEDVLVDNRIAMGELKVAEDGRVLQADEESARAIVRKQWYNPRKVVWTEYKPIHPEECPPGPYIHWRVRKERLQNPGASVRTRCGSQACISPPYARDGPFGCTETRNAFSSILHRIR